MFIKKNSVLSFLCLTMITTAPLAQADDYPDKIDTLSEVVGNPRIDLGAGMNTSSFKLYYYYRNLNFDEYRDQIKNAKFEERKIDYTYKSGYIEGVLESPEDVDLINIKIPNNYYFELLPQYLSDGTVIPYLLTDHESDYSTLLNGIVFGRVKSTYPENDDNKVPTLFDNLSYVVGANNTGTLFGGGFDYNEARINHQLYVNGQENYTLAVTGRGENMSFPYTYKMRYYITDQPLSKYHMNDIYDQTRNVDYEKRYFKTLEEINNDSSINVVMRSHSRALSTIADKKDYEIKQHEGNLYCMGVPSQTISTENERLTTNSSSFLLPNGFVNGGDSYYENIMNECEKYVKAFQTKDVLDKNKNFNIGREAESNYKNKVKKFLSYPETFDFLENNEFSKYFFNTDERGNFTDNYDKLHVILGDKFLDDNPFVRQSREVSVTNKRTGETESLIVQEAECASPYKYKKNQINEINYYETSYCLIGELDKIKSSTSVAESGVIGVMTGDVLRYEASGEYNDPLYPELDRSFNPVYEMTMYEIPLRGELSIDKNYIDDRYGTTVVPVRLVDQDANKNTNEVETITVKIEAASGDIESLELEETSANSGIFEGFIDLEISSSFTDENAQLEIELYSGYKVIFDVIYEDKYALREDIQSRGDDEDKASGPYDFNLEYYEENPQLITLEKELQLKSNATSDWSGGTTTISVNESNNFKIVDCGVKAQETISDLKIYNTTKDVEYSFKMEPQSNDCDLLIDNSTQNVKIIPETSVSDFEEGTYIVADEDDVLEVSYTDFSGADGNDYKLEGTVNVSGFIGDEGRVNVYGRGFYSRSYSFDKLYFYNDILKIFVNVRDDDLDITNGFDTGKVTLVNKTKNIEKEISVVEPSQEECENYFNSYICRIYSHFNAEVDISVNSNDEFFVEDGDTLEIVYNDMTYTDPEGIRVSEEFLIKAASYSEWMDFDLTLGKEARIKITDPDAPDWNGMGMSFDAGVVKIENLSKNYTVRAKMSNNYSEPEQMLTAGNVFLTTYDQDLAEEVDGAYVPRFGMDSYIEIPVEVGDEMRLTFTDNISPDGRDQNIVTTKTIQSYDVETDIVFFTNKIYPEDVFDITLVDKDANKNPTEVDTVDINYNWSRFSKSDSEIITLTETGEDTSIFKANVYLYSRENQTQNNGEIETEIRCSTCSNDLEFTYEKETETFTYEKETSYTVQPLSVEYNGSGAINDSLEIKITDPNKNSDESTEFSGEILVEYSNGESYSKVFYEYIPTNEITFNYDLKEKFPSDMTNEEFEQECAGSPWGEGPPMNADTTICADLNAKITVIIDKYGEMFEGEFTVDKKIPGLEMSVSNPVYIEDELEITVSDVLADLDKDAVDSVFVSVLSGVSGGDIICAESNCENNITGINDVEVVELLETGLNTGVFYGELIVTERLNNNDSEEKFLNSELNTKITKFTEEFISVSYDRSDFEDGNYIIENPILKENREILGGDLGVIDVASEEPLNSEVKFYINDKDRILNKDESFDVSILNTRTEESIIVDVIRYDDSRYFGNVKIGSDDALFYENYLKAEKGDFIEITYLDPDNKILQEEKVTDLFKISGGFDADLGVKNIIFTNDEVNITVVDQDGNVSVDSNDTLNVTVLNERTGEIENITLTENSDNSGVFEGVVSTVYSEDEIQDSGVLGVVKNDELTFTYIDELNSTNESEELTLTRIVSSGYTADILSPAYHEKDSDSLIPVNVYDADKNTAPFEKEEFDIVVTNQRTEESVEMSVIETRENSGVFTGLLNVKDNTQSDYLEVEREDILEFTYEDEFMADGSSGVITSQTEIVSEVSSVSGVLEASDPVFVVDSIEIKVTDDDLNEDSSEQETSQVSVLNERTGENEIVVVTESTSDSSIFIGNLSTVDGDDVNDEVNIMNVEKGDELAFSYIDDLNDVGETETITITRIIQAGYDGLLDIQKEPKVGEFIKVGVSDLDFSNDEVIEEIEVSVLNERTEEVQVITLIETAVDSSKFVGGVQTEYNESPLPESDSLGTVSGDDLTFTYIDEFNSSGEINTPITKSAVLSAGVDGELSIQSNEVVGSDILIKVIDQDENSTDEKDSIFVEVINRRTSETENVELIETGGDTGVFESVLPTEYSENFTSFDDMLSVLTDDLVSVVYVDDYNSDGGQTTLEENLVFQAGFDGEISVTSPNEIGDAMIVTVRDRDLNVTSGVDTVLVTVLNERTKESVELLLTEQVNSSDKERVRAGAANVGNAFVGMVYGVNDMVAKGNDSEIETFSGDYLVASYVDEFNSQGQSETLTAKGLFLGADAIVLDKNALEDSAVVGGLVPYTIEVENVSPNDLTNIEIIDNLPAGFRLAKDFVYVGDEKEPVSASGGVMTVTLDELDANETITLTYVLKVSSGVVEGAYENKVKPYIGSILVGNESRATVYVQDDPLFNDALVFGKVFNDVNGNGYLDNGEEGIPGVTIAGVDGINVVTDGKGRYSIEGVDGGRMDRGTNYILKVMPETLPEGSVFTTENPRVQRVTQGMPSKFNFGVKVPEQGAYTAMVEIRLGEVFFEWDKDNVKEEYASHLNRIANFIEEQGGGIIIIEGNTDSLGTDEYNEDLALRRASSVYKALKVHLSDEVFQNIEVRIIK